jgi:eukaryotic-like serine/threonine-protein kinase
VSDEGFEDTVERAALEATLLPSELPSSERPPFDRTSSVPSATDLPASDLATTAPKRAAALARAQRPDARGSRAPGSEAQSYRRGDTLGRYVVLDELGRGAMGAVYTAYDPELDRRVAVKVVHPDAQSSSAKTQGRGRLVREAKAMARLNHPNVIQVFDVGTLDGSGDVYIAMEYVPGRSLSAWLLEEERGWREILEVYTQAGLAVALAHAQGVVHRDFKPDNCLVDEEGRVRVIDFGIASRPTESPEDAEALARLTAETSAPNVRELAELARTQAGAVIGTPGYMAFEQLEGREADARSDQFALSVAVYEALYKQPPFAGRAFLERMVEVMEGRVRPAPEHSPAPAYLEPVLRRGLSTDPDDRFPSVEALLDALEPPSEERRSEEPHV